MKISRMSLDEIRTQHPDAYIDTFDAGAQPDDEREEKVSCLDVIVWPDEESSADDDGTTAIARYLIRA